MSTDMTIPEILEIMRKINEENTEARRKVREEAKRKAREEERELVVSILETMGVSKEDIMR